MKETKIVRVNLAREMIEASDVEYRNGNHKAIVSIDFIENLMHQYAEAKINNFEQQIKKLKEDHKKLLNDFSDWTMENEDSPNYITYAEVEHYLNKH